tara:strand:+ start:834 stop:1892 length:1059 start_codon:yes stop_codon:yes gene_type:complete
MNSDNKTILKGMNINELTQWCSLNNFDQFRAKQIYEWLYLHGVDSSSRMHNLSKEHQSHISKSCTLSTLEMVSKTISENKKTIKYLFKTTDSKFIESVSMIDENGRHTVCVSSQSGCNVGCDFCATADMGLMKNLSSGEIIDQLIIIRSLSDQPINNVVYMGMGEPFLNYDNVIKSADILNDKKGFNISMNKITISTAGIVPKIMKFINQKIKYRLAISLNASNDLVRTNIMPINKKWPISQLININKLYSKQYKRKKITFEYVIMDGINSSIEDAIALAKILSSAKCKVNIIPYNETDGKYKRPSDSTINQFVKTLSLHNNDNFQILVRWSNGLDIDAGCGQLAISNNIKE